MMEKAIALVIIAVVISGALYLATGKPQQDKRLYLGDTGFVNLGSVVACYYKDGSTRFLYEGGGYMDAQMNEQDFKKVMDILRK